MEIEKIKNPKFLKTLNSNELKNLSSEIRKFIIDNVSKNGGHLSSNLGAVDLTIAMHKVYNSPNDKFLFDVGHQAYTHKILTGRAKDFCNLRKYKGLSGFLKRSESKHDVWEAGHTSTSLSGAAGYAIARDLSKENYNVIAVIGDGAIASGMAYEALNHIGSLKTNITVILNDNEMSISKNVGAIHNYLDTIRTDKKYFNIKNKTKDNLDKLPFIGEKIKKSISLVNSSIKGVYNKNGVLFEQLGFKYFGPINGHDYNELIKYLEISKKMTTPVLIHVVTKKGKGYSYSENDKTGNWHGTSSFDIKTGNRKKEEEQLLSWSEVISETLIEISKKDKDIVVITPAMKKGSKLEKFEKIYKDRFIDVGIQEEHAITMSAGIALSGKKPFLSIYSTFLQRGYDQLLHDISRMNIPLVIGVDRAGIVGSDGETHQGLFDISFLSHMPNFNIVMPKDYIEARNLLYTAFTLNKPIAIRYPRGKTFFKKTKLEKIKYQTWERIKEGKNGYIITYGPFVNNAIKISKMLKEKNLEVGIINARFIKPMDEKMLREILNEQKNIYVYEESVENGSLGSMISTFMINNNYKNNAYLFNIKDKFIEQGEYCELLKELKLDIDSIFNKIKEINGI